MIFSGIAQVPIYCTYRANHAACANHLRLHFISISSETIDGFSLLQHTFLSTIL